MSNILPYRLAGGKSNNILFLTHQDPSYATSLRNRTAVLSWDEADDSPTLLQTKSDFDIYALIQATHGDVNPISLNLIGSRGNYIYYIYLNNVSPYTRWIIEVDYTSWTITKYIMSTVYTILYNDDGDPIGSVSSYLTWLDGDSDILYAVTTSEINTNLRKIIRYDATSYNPVTMYFDSFESSFECLYSYGVTSWNDSDPSLSGDATGFLSRWMVEINESTYIVTGGSYDIISYDSNYEETGQFSDAREKYLGWHCDRPNNYRNTAPVGPLICGLPSGRMFTVYADGLFYSSDTNAHIIEWNPSTFQAIRTSKLDTGISANPWIDADIQPSVALTGMSKGEKPDFQTSQNCTIIGLGALDSTIYTTTRYNFKEDSVLSTSPSNYRVFKPDAPCEANPPTISEWCPATTYLVQKRDWVVGEDILTAGVPVSDENTHVFILLGANAHDDIGYHWLLQCNASTMEVTRTKRLNNLYDDYDHMQYLFIPRSIAICYPTIYVYCNGGNDARMLEIDAESFALVDIDQIGGVNPGKMVKIGGDGANGYIYSTYNDSSYHLLLQKRDIRPLYGPDGITPDFRVIDEIDITSTYYPSSWVLPPCVSTDTRLWALGAGGNRLYLGGLDCINGTSNMLLYEFDPITLEFINSSNLCGADAISYETDDIKPTFVKSPNPWWLKDIIVASYISPVPPRGNTQIISFW